MSYSGLKKSLDAAKSILEQTPVLKEIGISGYQMGAALPYGVVDQEKFNQVLGAFHKTRAALLELAAIVAGHEETLKLIPIPEYPPTSYKGTYVEGTGAKTSTPDRKLGIKPGPEVEWPEELVKLQKFKLFVHDCLDALNVPHDPDPEHTKKTGCRISGRITELVHMTRRREEERLTKEHEQAYRELEERYRRLIDLDRSMRQIMGVATELRLSEVDWNSVLKEFERRYRLLKFPIATFSQVWMLVREIIDKKARHRSGWVAGSLSARDILKHLRSEVGELEEEILDQGEPDAILKEIADCFGCLIHLCYHRGHDEREVAEAILEKLNLRFTFPEENT